MKTIKTHLVQIFLLTLLFVFLLDWNVEAKEHELNFISGLEIIKEPALEIENWMLNESYWYNEDFNFMIKDEIESSLVLESWMFPNQKWLPAIFEYTSAITEKDLLIEQWMIKGMQWNKQCL